MYIKDFLNCSNIKIVYIYIVNIRKDPKIRYTKIVTDNGSYDKYLYIWVACNVDTDHLSTWC